MKAFQDLVDAGRKLSVKLASVRDDLPVVLALPRGGASIAREIAVALRAPFEVYREDRLTLMVESRTVVLVDDGVVTGATARAAIRSLAQRGAHRVILAVPGGPAAVLAELAEEAEVVSLGPDAQPYASPAETLRDDSERSRIRAVERPIEIALGDTFLRGDLAVPHEPRGLVIFAHGSGSSRKSPRNRLVANAFQSAQLATLLFDMLTIDEEALDDLEGRAVFDLERLAERLAAVTDWAAERADLRGLRMGYFGASTGAAAALRAAAARKDVYAIVSRGGRPDLAIDALHLVRAPSLLIVGGDDRDVLSLNRRVLPRLAGPKRLEIVEGATHLFDEIGALERVAHLSTAWFSTHLAQRAQPPIHQEQL
jgi:putative phosphoribosyl transferase